MVSLPSLPSISSHAGCISYLSTDVCVFFFIFRARESDCEVHRPSIFVFLKHPLLRFGSVISPPVNILLAISTNLRQNMEGLWTDKTLTGLTLDTSDLTGAIRAPCGLLFILCYWLILKTNYTLFSIGSEQFLMLCGTSKGEGSKDESVSEESRWGAFARQLVSRSFT